LSRKIFINLKIILDFAQASLIINSMKQDNSVAARLADYLNRMDMTIVRAAEISGLSIATISKAINGKASPNRRTAYKLERLISGTPCGQDQRRRKF
jgi:hypothetical protein